MIFWLGTHQVIWLARLAIPLFISRRRLCRRKTLPRAVAPWALDSGAFTELNQFGGWTLSPADYVKEVRRYRDEIGGMAWAAIQDWMCEPFVLQKTGLTIEDHQLRTIGNYHFCMATAPNLPWVPVLQGWEEADYLHHLELYEKYGTDLRKLPLVGLGSVCRRQGTVEADHLIRRLHGMGLKLHAFGFKVLGLRRCSRFLSSSDSMAWPIRAKNSPRLEGCIGHKKCTNCHRFALRWRRKVLTVIKKSLGVSRYAPKVSPAIPSSGRWLGSETVQQPDRDRPENTLAQGTLFSELVEE